MDEETRAEVERAYREHKGAQAWARETEDKLFTVLQRVLKAAEENRERGTQAELMKITDYSRERLRQIKIGRWRRSRPLQ